MWELFYRSIIISTSTGTRQGGDKFQRPPSPNRSFTPNRSDRRRASWTSRVGTPDTSVTGSSDTLHLLSPTGTGRNKFTPISVQPQSPSRQSPLPFTQTARRSPLNLQQNGLPPPSPMRKLTPIPSATPSGLTAHKSAQSIEILFEDEGEDGTEVWPLGCTTCEVQWRVVILTEIQKTYFFRSFVFRSFSLIISLVVFHEHVTRLQWLSIAIVESKARERSTYLHSKNHHRFRELNLQSVTVFS